MGMTKRDPERCHIKRGVVTEIIIYYENGVSRYVVCNPLFFDTCQKHIEKLNEMGVDYVKLNTGNDSDREWLNSIMAECDRAKVITYS